MQNKDWQASDGETYFRMLDVAGTKAQAEGAIGKDEMNALSCVDLKTIDRLWSTASDGKLGFSAQEKILREKNDYRKMYNALSWQTLTGEWLIQWNYNQQTKRYEYKPGKEPNFKTFPPEYLPSVERGYNFGVSLDVALVRCGV
ncbi:GUN4 domain-containing protein [Nostoc sp. C117]|uniref:GUN4 domain-containing protein n=1 Tax=Nostoc sp. C117 TaxID=3349875 RepID=UPI00370D7A82